MNNIALPFDPRIVGENLIKSLIAVVLAVILTRLGHWMTDRILTRKSEGRMRFISPVRIKTMNTLIRSIITYSYIIVVTMYLLSLWFGTVGITLAGVGGIALGFGAQSIIKDILAGFFIILEDKYKIGDFVTLDSKSGIVDSIGLRTTVLKDYTGEYHMVPNGSVDVVTNGTMGDRRILVEITADRNIPVSTVKTIIEEVCEEYYSSNEEFIERPQFVGIVRIESNDAVYRIHGRSQFIDFWRLENGLREALIRRMADEGITSGNGMVRGNL